MDVPQRRAQIVRHGITEGFQLLVDDGQFRGVRGVALTLDLVLPQRVLEAFQLGHVARRGEHALQTPVTVVEGGRVVRHHGFLAVAGARGELVVGDFAFGQHALDARLGPAGIGEVVLERRADQLVPRAPGERLRLLVDVGDDAARIGASSGRRCWIR